MGNIVSVMVTFIVLFLGLVFLEPTLSDTITEGAMVTIDSTAGDNTLTLPKEHWYTTDRELSVTYDGEAVAVDSVSDDRRTVTIDATVVADKEIVVNYITENDNDLENIVLKSFPFIVVVIMLIAAFSAIKGGVGNYRMGGDTSMSSGAAILIIIGGVMFLPIIMAFRTEAVTAFEPAVEYIGVAIAMPMVILAYIAALFGLGLGSVGPAARRLVS